MDLIDESNRTKRETGKTAPKRITLGKEEHSSVFGILISLYALNARSDICVPSPFKSFKDFPDSMPYAGAFTTHTEQLLVPHVAKIKEAVQRITKTLKGKEAPSEAGGDFSFIMVFNTPSACGGVNMRKRGLGGNYVFPQV